jgi:hypothetical protein
VGVKLTATVQLAPPASDIPQLLLVIEKSPLIDRVMPARIAPPVFVMVTNCAVVEVPISAEPKLKALGETLSAAGVSPTPVNVTTVGVVAEFRLSDPLRTPATVGVKLTATEQLAPLARVVPQVELGIA